MNRRKFIRNGLMSLAGGMYGWSSGGLLTGPASAQAATGEPLLVVVFMRGGWDGLNVCVPYGDEAYYSLRPNIAIAAPGSGKSDPALDLDGFFGFHPSLAPLHAMYQEGQVAVLPAVHYANASQSHFSGQDIIEHGSPSIADTGWLARYLEQISGTPSERAISLTETVPRSLFGLTPTVSAFSDLKALNLAVDANDRTLVTETILAGYAAGDLPANANANALKAIGLRVPSDLQTLQSAAQLPVEYGAIYPGNVFGRQMAQAATMVKARAGLNVISLNFGSWDTHSYQGGGQPAGEMSVLLATFAKGVSAFFTDIGAHASRVMVLAVTEFGRTAAENGSQGTDHGNATTWLAIGPGVRGGIYPGATGWPGLGAASLYKGRYLAHTIEFQNVYAEVLKGFLGVTNTSAVLPGLTPVPIGFLG